MKTKIHIGLDVHKESVVVGIARKDGSKPENYGKLGGSNLSVERGLSKLLKKEGVGKEEVSICYEAGPTGFVLGRRLIQVGYDCMIVAPSKIPKAPGEKVKTDRRDARKLARLLRAGELGGIHIPEPKDEAVRDLCRARTDAAQALSRAKQQLGSFLLRNGIRYQGKTNWTQKHMNYLRRKKLPDASQQIVLEEYIIAIDAGEERVRRLVEHMKEQLENWDRKPYVDALMCFRGFATVSAMTVISELGDLSRFSHPRSLMGFLGMVSAEESSGEKRRQGAITKTGNGHARWMIIECASHYSHAPTVSPALSARQEGQSRGIRAIAWRAQLRLNKRYKRLTARNINRNKAVVAIARELCGFLWELHAEVTKEQAERAAA